MPMDAKFPAISRLTMPCRRLQIRTAPSAVAGSTPPDAFADSLRGILPPWQVPREGPLLHQRDLLSHLVGLPGHRRPKEIPKAVSERGLVAQSS